RTRNPERACRTALVANSLVSKRTTSVLTPVPASASATNVRAARTLAGSAGNSRSTSITAPPAPPVPLRPHHLATHRSHPRGNPFTATSHTERSGDGDFCRAGERGRRLRLGLRDVALGSVG